MPHNKKIVDLTQIIKPSSPCWNGDACISMPIVWDYDDCTTTSKVRTHELNFKSIAGTHIDAPAHFIKGGRTIEQLGVEELIAPCVVINTLIDVTAETIIDMKHIDIFERTHRAAYKGSIVLFKTGWSKHWSNTDTYRNGLTFPTISGDVARHIISCGALAIGIDTLGPDLPGDRFTVHEIVLGADRYLIENVTNLDQLPPIGATIMVMPIPVAGATESPTRVIALL